MLATAFTNTLSQLFAPKFRAVLWKSIGLTIAMLIGLWFALQTANTTFLIPMLKPWPWVATMLTWVLGAGFIIGLGFLIAPVTSVFAGVFLDDVAEEVERVHYPQDGPGTPLPLGTSIGISLRFFALVLVGNLIALILALVLGLGVIIFFVLNGYLLGREYFQFAALRHRSQEETETMRKRHAFEIFLAGLMIAVLLSIPLVNLLTPIFAGALMVHVYKHIERKSGV